MHTLEVTASNSITTCYFVKKRSWGKKQKSKHTLLNFCFLECKWKECTWRHCRGRMPLQVGDHQPYQRKSLLNINSCGFWMSLYQAFHILESYIWKSFLYWQLNYSFPNEYEKIIINNHIASTLCIKYHLE